MALVAAIVIRSSKPFRSFSVGCVWFTGMELLSRLCNDWAREMPLRLVSEKGTE